jgi:predicted nucleic acid-binding protein
MGAAFAANDYFLRNTSKLIVLDSGPLGIAANPRFSQLTFACNQWLNRQIGGGVQIAISEVADYEVRRELIRLSRQRSLARLDKLKSDFVYLPIATSAMLKAAELWAQARRIGRPTAADAALDADVIVAAQASLLIEDGDDVTVATTNPKHLSLFVPAARWQDIP